MKLHDDDRQLIEDLYEPLCRFAAVVAPPDVEPEDLLQDAVVGALGRRPLTEYNNLAAYLRRALVSLATDHRRRFGRRARAMARWGEPDDSVPAAYPSDIAELMRLPSVTRAVLYLVDVEGFTFDEAADQVGCTPDAARARASRARRELRLALEEDRT